MSVTKAHFLVSFEVLEEFDPDTLVLARDIWREVKAFRGRGAFSHYRYADGCIRLHGMVSSGSVRRVDLERVLHILDLRIEYHIEQRTPETEHGSVLILPVRERR